MAGQSVRLLKGIAAGLVALDGAVFLALGGGLLVNAVFFDSPDRAWEAFAAAACFGVAAVAVLLAWAAWHGYAIAGAILVALGLLLLLPAVFGAAATENALGGFVVLAALCGVPLLAGILVLLAKLFE